MNQDYFITRFQGLSDQIGTIVQGVADGATLEWVLIRLGAMDGSIRLDISEYESLKKKESLT